MANVVDPRRRRDGFERPLEIARKCDQTEQSALRELGLLGTKMKRRTKLLVAGAVCSMVTCIIAGRTDVAHATDWYLLGATLAGVLLALTQANVGVWQGDAESQRQLLVDARQRRDQVLDHTRHEMQEQLRELWGPAWRTKFEEQLADFDEDRDGMNDVDRRLNERWISQAEMRYFFPETAPYFDALLALRAQSRLEDIYPEHLVKMREAFDAGGISGKSPEDGSPEVRAYSSSERELHEWMVAVMKGPWQPEYAYVSPRGQAIEIPHGEAE